MTFLLVPLLLLLNFSNAVKYNFDDNSAVISLGDKEIGEVRLQIMPGSNELLVFGPGCSKADSCTTKSHGFFDPTNNTKKKGAEGIFGPYKYVEYDDVTVAVGNLNTIHKVKVIDELKVGMNKTDDRVDGRLGLSIEDGEDSLFSKLLSSQGNDSFFLIIPQNSKKQDSEKNSGNRVSDGPIPEKDTGEGKLLIGEEDELACGRISSIITEKKNDKPSWEFKTTAIFHEDAVEVRVELDFNTKNVVGLSERIIKQNYKDDKINLKQYNELKDIRLSVGSSSHITIPKNLFFWQSPGSENVYNKKFRTTSVDVSIPLDVLNKYCIKLAKEGEVYKIGVSERKNLAGLVLVSFSIMIYMLLLLQL